MARGKKHTAEQIVSLLRQIEVAVANGKTTAQASKDALITEQTYYRWRKEFGGLQVDQQRKDLYAGLGVIVFTGPQGPGFFKGGHDNQTGNTMVCVERSERCVVILSNDVRAEKGYADLVKFVLGDTGVPYDWEYGDQAGKS